MRWTGKVLDRIFVVLGALLCLQLPLFISYYQQQLAGRVAELTWQVDAMREIAKKSKKNLEQYLYKFSQHRDEEIAAQGSVMVLTYERWNRLSKALAALEHASAWKRPWVFFRYLQWDIVKSTASSFKPGVIVNGEGIAYSLAGIGIGYLFFRIIQSIIYKAKKHLYRAK